MCVDLIRVVTSGLLYPRINFYLCIYTTGLLHSHIWLSLFPLFRSTHLFFLFFFIFTPDYCLSELLHLKKNNNKACFTHMHLFQYTSKLHYPHISGSIYPSYPLSCLNCLTENISDYVIHTSGLYILYIFIFYTSISLIKRVDPFNCAHPDYFAEKYLDRFVYYNRILLSLTHLDCITDVHTALFIHTNPPLYSAPG